MPQPPRPRRPPRRLDRRPRRPPPNRGPARWPYLALALLVPLAFYAGRLTVPEPTEPETPERAEAPPQTECVEVTTSTAGLCPCPKPRPPRPPKKLAIDGKAPDPVVTPDFEREDPTQATAEYLKRASRRLAVCAPPHGARTRVHLEVTVRPDGTIDQIGITNVDPVPGPIATCVERELRALTPPGFDATEPQTFGLTVVL